MGRQFADAIQGPMVQTCGAMRLRLQPDTDVLDGPRYDGVGYAGKRSGEVVLGIR